MILTTHMAAGAALGLKIENSLLLFPVSIAVHFLMDLIPHGDYLNKKSKMVEFWKVAVDLAIGLIIICLAYRLGQETNPDILWRMAMGAFFSLLPDLTTFLYWKLGFKFLGGLKRFHENLHYYPNMSPGREFTVRNAKWDILLTLAFSSVLFIF